MNSKYWTSGHQKSTITKSMHGIKDEIDSSTTATSIEDDLTMKRMNPDSSSSQKRPDSLNLSFNLNEITTSDLTKMTTDRHHHHLNSTINNENPNVIQTSGTSVSAVDVNQSKSLSVAGNKSHQNGKKSTTSYDLWVNENVGMKEKSENSASNVAVAAREKKLDLPGRVSFSFRYVKKFSKREIIIFCVCSAMACPSRSIFSLKSSVQCWSSSSLAL